MVQTIGTLVVAPVAKEKIVKNQLAQALRARLKAGQPAPQTEEQSAKDEEKFRLLLEKAKKMKAIEEEECSGDIPNPKFRTC